MERYGGVSNITFGQQTLGLPMSVRVRRAAEPRPAGADSDRFVTSIQLAQPTIVIEVRTRDTAAAEDLSLGESGELSLELAGTRAEQPSRIITISNAVLAGVELDYQQAAPAVVLLTFAAEAPDGGVDPFTAQEAQP